MLKGRLIKITNIMLSLLLVIGLCQFPVSSKAQAATPQSYKINFTATAKHSQVDKILRYTNQERAAVGLPPLELDKYLSEYAMQRAGETVIKWDHERPNGKEVTANKMGNNTTMGENIAVGHPTAEAVMKGWMKSEGHRKNILKSDYTSIGIGAVEYKGQYFWVQLFGNYREEYTAPAKDVSRKYTTYATPSNLYLTQYFDKGYTKSYIYHRQPGDFSWPNVYLYPSCFDWSSSNTNVARVSNGKITKVGTGTAYISAKLGPITKSRQIRVSEHKLVTMKSRKLYRGKTYKMKTPNNYSAKYYKWSVGNKSLATVSENGYVKAKYPGITHVYAKRGNTTYKYRIRIVPYAVRDFKASKRSWGVQLSWRKTGGMSGVVVYGATKRNGKYNFKKWAVIDNPNLVGMSYVCPGHPRIAFKVYSYKYMDGARYLGPASKTYYLSL